jgi:nitrogen fixation/metabolism regulation signal transduction histidine kinase
MVRELIDRVSEMKKNFDFEHRLLMPDGGDGRPVEIEQVVMNLILNGIQAMSAVEDRKRDLIVRTQGRDGDQVLVAVQDSGVGIDPRNAERIFDAFHTTKPGGMGMGHRSVVRLLRVTAGGFGPLRTTVPAQPFNSLFENVRRITSAGVPIESLQP